MQNNPYSLLFGKEPKQMISRMSDLAVVTESFTAEEPTQQIYMITGVRGCGKTVFMSEAAKIIRELKEWVVVELNPERNLLIDLAEKLNSDRVLAEFFRQAQINLSFLGIGVDIGGVNPITNIEVALERMLTHLKKRGKRVLVTIDEVVSNAYVREFAHSFQMFIRNDLPIFLLMTGLYENIHVLQNEKSLTFLYRAPKIDLKPLSIRTIADNYQENFQLDRDAAMEMAKMTGGYSFAFQVLGYFTWENNGDFRTVENTYRNYLADYSYDKIWTELSAEDRRVSYGIAMSSDGRIAEIRKRLEMDTNHFNPYRKRLIRKGIVNGEEYGIVRFVLPFFGEYVLENYDG